MTQDEQLARLDSQLSDLSRQVHEEKIANIIESTVVEAVDKLQADITHLRGIAVNDRGDISSEIDIESRIAAT
jgi:hypothetical protein